MSHQYFVSSTHLVFITRRWQDLIVISLVRQHCIRTLKLLTYDLRCSGDPFSLPVSPLEILQLVAGVQD